MGEIIPFPVWMIPFPIVGLLIVIVPRIITIPGMIAVLDHSMGGDRTFTILVI